MNEELEESIPFNPNLIISGLTLIIVIVIVAIGAHTCMEDAKMLELNRQGIVLRPETTIPAHYEQVRQ